MNHSKDTSLSAARYWGYLIKPDKTPTPIFEQLLLGVANYINRHVAPWDVHCLTPTKLATFYKLVGGDYDPLFLDTSRASLSFIYQSLGCFHTLQPEKNPYSPPTVPALTPQGFVRWQTVQLLLEPDEHVPFLQEAVKRFELTNPTDGELFPSVLPRESLPAKADLQMTEWHESVSEKLMLEAQASQMRNMPRRPQMALSDGDPAESSRPSSGDSTIESSSMIGGPLPRPIYLNSRPHPPPRPSMHTQPKAHGSASQQKQPPPAYDAPWSPLRRRSSMPSDNRPQYHHPSSWPRGHPMSPLHQNKFAPPSSPTQAQQNRRGAHARTPSTLSESSFTSDSSYTTSSASASPVLQSAQMHQAAGGAAQGNDMRRSQSVGYFNPPPPSRHAVYPNPHHPHPVQFPHSQQYPPSSGGGDNINTNATNTSPSSSKRPNAPNDKGLNVRWPDQAGTSRPAEPASTTNRMNRSGTVRGPTAEDSQDDRRRRSARSVDGRRSEREREREKEFERERRRGQSVGYT